MPDKLKIMLVDDHYLVRMGLRSIIALEPDMTVCAEASTGEQAQVLFRSHRPDVTLMDLRLPGMNGSETIHEIRGEFPDARMVMISTYVGRRGDLRRAPGRGHGVPGQVRAARGADARRFARRRPASGTSPRKWRRASPAA